MRTHIDDERLWEVWNWCFEAYIRHGKKISFPVNTDYRKTYQWRYISAIATKFEEWQFDEATAKKFIDIAISHSKHVGAFRKGLAALHQGNMLQICFDTLQREMDNSNQSLESLRNVKYWLDTQIGDGDPLDVLLRKDQHISNITMWYQASKITPLFLALSKQCGKAIARLARTDPDERLLLPKSTNLYKLRTEFLDDDFNKHQAKQLFGSDWRKMCL